MSKKHKIAIIQTDYDYDADRSFVQSFTDWTEVDTETLNILKESQHMFKFYVVEQILGIDFIPNTIASWLLHIEKMDKQIKEEEAKRQQAILDKRIKKKAKTEADERKLFDELSKKFSP